MVRVILDTNIYAGGAFDALERSPFLACCHSGSIQPVCPHTMLEETLRSYGREDRREDLIHRWIPYLFQSKALLAQDLQTIFHEELVQGRGRHARRFMSPSASERLRQRLARVPRDGSWSAWHNSQAMRDEERGKQGAQRKLSGELRAEAGLWIKENPDAFRAATERDLNRARSQSEYAFGTDYIRRQIRCWNPDEVASRWSRAPRAYPFYTQFVKNIVFMFVYAMVERNQRIDNNAQPDLDILTHLLHADVIVSNETGFLRSAFETLWRPRGKVLMTLDQFLAYIA